MHFLRVLEVLWLCVLTTCNSLYIDGCPLFGCRPSGSFSQYMDVPKANASVNWISNFHIQAPPTALGCVADSVSIICPTNGVFTNEKGFASLYTSNGTVRWRDTILENPALPILDNNGDVTASDGVSLVHYDVDGKKYPVIPCEGLQPVFSMQVVGSHFLLLISESGGIVVRESNGVPVGELWLNATVFRTNGTFLPIAQPVVNGQRFYLLAEFVPTIENEYVETEILNLQRVYAIDVHSTIDNRITIAWYYNFEMEVKTNSTSKQKYSRKEHIEGLKDTFSIGNQLLLWNEHNQTLFVILPHPYMAAYASPPVFWALEDSVQSVKFVFRSSLPVTNMAIFESNQVVISKTPKEDFNPILWVILEQFRIASIYGNGAINRTIDLSDILSGSAQITTKLTAIRNEDKDTDILVFGVTFIQSNDQNLEMINSSLKYEPFTPSYVIAIDTGNDIASLLWMVPVPENMIPRGQISIVDGADERTKDQFVVYAENDKKSSALIFSIH